MDSPAEMIMAGKDHPKLMRKPSSVKLHKSASRLSIDTKFKVPRHREVIESKDVTNGKDTNGEYHAREKIKQENGKTGDHEKEKEKDVRKGKKGKKKEIRKKNSYRKEGTNDVERKLFVGHVEGMAERRESFRHFVFHKVKAALSIVYLDGVTSIDVDNVTPLMKSLDVATHDEAFIDLIRNAVFDNSGELAPLELDELVMTTHENNELVDVDECLETAFRLIDFDDDGFITQEDIKQLMLLLGETLGDYVFDDMVVAVDMDQDGKISLRDFRHFLLGRDVPSKKEIQIMAANARNMREANITVQHEGDLQDDNDDKLTSKDSVDTKHSARMKNFYKCRSAIKGFKLTSETDPFTIIPSTERKALVEGKSCFDLALEEAEHQDLIVKDDARSNSNTSQTISSRRKLDSIIRKKLFFGGFINKDRSTASDVHFDTIIQSSAQTEENPSNKQIDFISRHSSVKVLHEEFDITQMGNSQLSYSEVEQDIILGEDTEDDNEDRTWEKGPLSLESGNQSLNIPPPDLSMVDISDSKETSTPPESPQLQSALSETGGLVLVSSEEDVRIMLEAAELSHQSVVAPNVNSVDIGHQRPRSCSIQEETRHISCSIQEETRPKSCSIQKETRPISSTTNDENASTRYVLKLRPHRKSSNSSKTVLKTHANRTSEVEVEGTYSSERHDKGGIDSDEGIELTDEELIQRAVHIPLSPKASSTSLRIYLPREVTAHGSNPLEEDRSRISTPRPRITIDLQNFSVDDEDDEKEDLNDSSVFDLNVVTSNSRYNSRKELTDMKPKLRYPDCEDSLTDIDAQQNNTHNTHRPRPLTETKVNLERNQSAYDNRDDCLIPSKNREGVHYRYHRPLQNKHKEEDIPSYLPKHPEESYIRSSSHDHAKTSRPATSSLTYQTMELKDLEPISTTKQRLNKPMLASTRKDVATILSTGRNTGVEDNVTWNFSETVGQGRFPTRAHTDKVNLALKLENPTLLQSPATSSQEREIHFRQWKTSTHDKLFAPREPAVISDSSGHFTKNKRKVEHRKLKRSQTSFELPTVLETENRPGIILNEPAKSVPKRRSFSASACRNTKSSNDAKPKHQSISIINLSEILQIESPHNKHNVLSKRHYASSNIVPLSRVVGAYHMGRTGYQKSANYSLSRQLQKNGVPYFLHNSSGNDTLTSAAGKHLKINTNKRSKNKSSNSDDLEDPDLVRLPHEEDVATLLGDFKDPDIIQSEVIFHKVRHFTRDFYRK